MKTQKIIDALEYWSPKGLCNNVLVMRNGDHRKSIGCAIGCLVLETLRQPEGLKALREQDKVSDNTIFPKSTFIKRLINASYGSICEDFPVVGKAVHTHFGLTDADEKRIIAYNDHCMDAGGPPFSSLPRSLKAKIKALRQRYEDWQEFPVHPNKE